MAHLRPEDVARWRGWSMGLWGKRFESPEAVVAGLLAVQAENHSQASWALAVRTGGAASAADVAGAFDEGRLLRTHVLRPTWHFVSPDDVRWLVDVTRPGVRRAYRQLARTTQVDDDVLGRTRDLLTATLADGRPRTRSELGDVLGASGLPGEGMALGHVLADAETEALVCSGPLVGGEHTHVLLEQRAPRARRLDREEALAEMAWRYVVSHGPVTERDLAYWGTLTLTDARTGVAGVADRLQALDVDGRRYWAAGDPPPDAPVEPRAHLLQLLDEYHNGVQHSRDVLDVAGLRPPGRQTSVGMVLVDTQVVGGMRRTLGESRVRFDVDLLRDLDADEAAAVEAAASRYATWLGREPDLRGHDRVHRGG